MGNRHCEEYSTLVKGNVILKNRELWKKFHELDTEMIITKSGRRMFPSLSVEISGLEPDAEYCVLVEMARASRCRYKYAAAGGWSPAGAADADDAGGRRAYLHPDSPATGAHWMAQPVSFGRLKLTNSAAAAAAAAAAGRPPLVLASMHRYEPRVAVARTADARAALWGAAPAAYFAFPETRFVAVTAYQNERVTRLKIDHNPFAKGFRESGRSKCKRKRAEEAGAGAGAAAVAAAAPPPALRFPPPSRDPRPERPAHGAAYWIAPGSCGGCYVALLPPYSAVVPAVPPKRITDFSVRSLLGYT